MTNPKRNPFFNPPKKKNKVKTIKKEEKRDPYKEFFILTC